MRPWPAIQSALCLAPFSPTWPPVPQWLEHDWCFPATRCLYTEIPQNLLSTDNVTGIILSSFSYKWSMRKWTLFHEKKMPIFSNKIIWIFFLCVTCLHSVPYLESMEKDRTFSMYRYSAFSMRIQRNVFNAISIFQRLCLQWLSSC